MYLSKSLIRLVSRVCMKFWGLQVYLKYFCLEDVNQWKLLLKGAHYLQFFCDVLVVTINILTEAENP